MEKTEQSGYKPEKGLVPISTEQRESHPNVIYQLESNSQYDIALTQASFAALRQDGFDVVVDVEATDHGQKVLIRSGAKDRKDQVSEGALLEGLTEATRRRMQTSPSTVDEPAQYYEKAQTTAHELLSGLTSNQELYEAFKGYYGGLRWGTDQEKFVHDLFVHASTFDAGFLDEQLTGGQLGNLVYELDLDIPYNKRDKWYDKKPDEIFHQFPQLDYRRLEQEDFRNSPEGQQLTRAYTKLSGDILAQQQKRGERLITEDGQEISRPLIPLSKHPIIESLIADEVSLDRPKPKYSFGPSELTDIIINSDSQIAHEALVSSIITRLPEGQRRVFDGPNEFEHKRGTIWSILRAYKEAYGDDSKRGTLRQDLVDILDAYTGTGSIAENTRDEYQARVSSGRESYASSETNQVKGIVTDILTIALTSPDVDVVGKAEDLISQYLPESGRELTIGKDPLSIERGELRFVLIDALKNITAESHPEVFERLGVRVFGDESIGRQLRNFAELKMQADKLRNRPENLQALAQLRKFSFSLGDKPNPEKERAEQTYAEKSRPGNQITEELRQLQNRFLLDQLRSSIETGDLQDVHGESGRFFSGIAKRVEFSDYHMQSLSIEYQELISLAKDDRVPDRLKNDVLWQIAKQYEYVDSQSARLLVPVILDMYEVALGPTDAVRLPSRDAYLSLAAATHLVSKHGREMFKSASHEELETLSRYGQEIRKHVERLATGAFLPEDQVSAQETDTTASPEWQKQTLENLRDVARELQSIGQYYEEYLRVEAVKVKPNVYYPWLLEKIAPFWQKMQWEVGPGNRPSRDISELYRVLEDHVRTKLVLRKPEDYEDGFDVLGEGHLDSLLKECYERMVVPHDIKYNTTVWQDGLTFMHYAVAYMPESTLESIKAKYPRSQFVEYLEKERERWNKEE